jgi:alpha-glucoside transport system substrate-binding protein
MKSIVFGEIIMKKIKMKKRFGFIGTLMVAIVALTGVAHADSHLKFPIGEGGFNWDSYHAFAKEHDYTGQQVTWTTRVTGSGETNINNMMAYFAEATGAKVKHVGSQTYKQDVVANLEGGTPPEITGISLPGFGQDLSRRGFFTPLCEDPNDCELSDWIRENYASGDAWADLGIWEGPDGKKHFYGFHYYTYVKSMVWYVPENFEDAGYKIPRTQDELKTLENRIVADGGTPWCIGLFSEGATGFPGSDWMEDLLLRSHPPELYDQWVSNEVPFDDPRIVAALEEWGEFARNEKYVAGGVGNVAIQDWRDSPKGLFDSPPKCYMHLAGTYITSFFPKGVKYGDWDFFYFPARASKPELGKPVMGGGNFWTISKNSPAAHGFIKWLQTPIAVELALAQGGDLSPHLHVNKAVFTDPAFAALNDILLNATTYRFDASDLMPGAVGGGTFWRGMVDYVGGKDAAAVARDIQKSWDAIK